MAEGAAAGIPPHILIDYTPRELYAAMRGLAMRENRAQKLSLWESWNTANFSRAKKLPALEPLLRKLDPSPVKMTAKAIRRVIFGMAEAMGAKITRRPKKRD